MEVYPIGTEVEMIGSEGVTGIITYIYIAGKVGYITYCVEWWENGQPCEGNFKDFQIRATKPTNKIEIGFIPKPKPDEPVYA